MILGILYLPAILVITDLNGNQYHRSYEFDLNYIGGLVWTKKTSLKDVTENLKGINKGIEELNAKI